MEQGKATSNPTAKSTSIPPNRPTDPLLPLLPHLQASFPTRFDPRAWYVVIFTCLTTLNKTTSLRALCAYLLQPPHTHGSPTITSRTLRDVLFKTWTLIGIPLVINAFAQLASVEDELGLRATLEAAEKENGDAFRTRLLSDTEAYARGTKMIDSIYLSDLAPIFDSFGAHKHDIEWLEKRVIYGEFLSEDRVLGVLESELVTLTAIMCQGLEGPTRWHLKGIRRLGVGRRDVERVEEMVRETATAVGVDGRQWVSVGAVEDEI
ncbi:MAG: hypothetical protein M1824_003659 [Vezdaea acicularis]|nr:MAG: hypothetical protein M1824_003659 [Vezdaea acicularis]